MEKKYFLSFRNPAESKDATWRKGGVVWWKNFVSVMYRKSDVPKVYKLCNSLESRLDSVSANCLNHKLLVLNSKCILGKRCSIQGT